MRKRILAFVMTMAIVLSLLPMGTLAAGEHNVLYVGGTDVFAGGYWTGDGKGGLIPGTAENYTVRYEPDTKTLTLRNAEISKAYSHVEKVEMFDPYYAVNANICGIYSYVGGTLNLYLEGATTIQVPSVDEAVFQGMKINDTDSPNICSYGILTGPFWGGSSREAENLTVSGTGSCTVTAGTIDGKALKNASVYSYGLNSGEVNMESGTLVFNAADILGTETCDGDKAQGNTESWGISSGKIAMKHGTLIGRGGNVTVCTSTNQGSAESTGILMNNGLALAGGSLEGYGGAVVGGSSASSRGVYRYMGSVAINGGVLKAIAGDVSATGESYGSSFFCDVYSHGYVDGFASSMNPGTIPVNGGTFVAACGKAQAPAGARVKTLAVGQNLSVTPPVVDYWWRTAENAEYTSGRNTAFVLTEGQTYVEITSEKHHGEEETPAVWDIHVLTQGNGAVSVTPETAKKGEKITVRVYPEKACQLSKLTVRDKKGDIILTEEGNGVYTFTMPDAAVTVTAVFEAIQIPAELFSDVDADDWFYGDVTYVCENGLMNGTSEATFSPNATTTRGMIVTVLHRLEGTPNVSAKTISFADVSDDAYYSDAVAWAAENGIVTGYNNKRFAPNDSISREQMATILWRYAEYKNYDISEKADLSLFQDQGSISSYAVDAMAWANASGLIAGVDDDTLSPKGKAIRAQVAAILHRFCENIAQ